MNVITDRAEIIKTIQDRVKAANPNVNIEVGSPLYDLLITHFADILVEERDLVNIVTNISRVVPMFDTNGALLLEYSDMTDYITDRFFLNPPQLSDIWDTVYLKFSKRGNVTIKSGSYILFETNKVPISPMRISQSSALWTKTDGGYLHPIRINTVSSLISEFIPATEGWSTGFVEYIAETAANYLTGAVSKKALNTQITPPLTLDYVRNSISNRSWSNIRSMIYNFRTNTVFSPDALIMAKVMHVTDDAFIERRKILWEDDDYILDAVVSGDGKVLVDYGTELIIKPVDLGYVSRAEDIYSEVLPITIMTNPRNIIRYIQLDGITGAFSTSGILYGKLIEAYVSGEYVLTLEFYKTVDMIERVCYGTEVMPDTGVLENYRNIRFVLLEDNYSGITGWCGVTFDKEYFDVGNGTGIFIVSTDNFSLYKIDTRGLGLLCPVAIGSESELETLKGRLESFNTTDIIPAYTRANSTYPASRIIPRGDDAGQIASLVFVPADLDMAALAWGSLMNKTLYWRIQIGTDTIKKFIVTTDQYFRDNTQLITSTVIPDSYIAGTTLTLDVTQNSFLTMKVVFSKDYFYIEENVATDNYLAVPGSFVRVANSHVMFASSCDSIAANSADGDEVYMLYYGTPSDPFVKAQEALLNLQHMEIGNRILVNPYRPILFTCFYKPEYVSPFMTDRDYSANPNGVALNARLEDRKSQYTDLVEYLTNYFADFKGLVTDIDFSELLENAQAASGMTLKRLDFTLATQRGFIIRGQISIGLDEDTFIDWTYNIVDVIEEEVDNAYQTSNYYVRSYERESLITDVTMYKPVFSRVLL